MTVTNISAYDLVRDSAFSDRFGYEALDAIAEYLEEFGEIDYSVIDNLMLNSEEYDSIEKACKDHYAKDEEELLDNDNIAYVAHLENGGVVVIQ